MQVTENSTYGYLVNYITGEHVRPAKRKEYLESVTAAKTDGGAGVFELNGSFYYVAGGPDA